MTIPPTRPTLGAARSGGEGRHARHIHHKEGMALDPRLKRRGRRQARAGFQRRLYAVIAHPFGNALAPVDDAVIPIQKTLLSATTIASRETHPRR